MSDDASQGIVFEDSEEEEVVDVSSSSEIVSHEDVVDDVSLSEIDLVGGELNDEKKS